MIPENIKEKHILQAIEFLKNNGVQNNRRNSSKVDLLFENETYPPKLVISKANEYANGIELDSKLFVTNQAQKHLVKEGFKIINKNEIPSTNGSVIYPQSKKYQNSIDNTEWLTIGEIYKFKFVQWIEEHIDFINDSNEDIKQKIVESQQIAYSEETNAKGVNFIQSIIRNQEEYLTIADIDKLKKIISEELIENKENLQLSFNSFPRTSTFLSLFAPDKYMAYDRESIPAYEFLSNGVVGNEIAPKRNYKAFKFYQIFYQNIKEQLKNSHLDVAIFKKLLGVENLSELQWNFIAQDFLLFISRKIMKNTYKTLDITGHRIYKISMGTFLKSAEYKHINPIEEFEKNNLIVMHEDTAVQQGIDFRDNLKRGDFIYLTYGQERLSFIGKIIGDSEKVNTVINIDLDDKWLCRKVEIIENPVIDKTHDLKGKDGWMPSGYTTFKEILNINSANNILFKKYYNVKIIDEHAPEKLKEIEPEIDLKIPLNQILYGAPGTGKTYLTKKLAVEIIKNKIFSDSKEDRAIILEHYKNFVENKNIHFTTFHQSLSYEDFVEGIKPKFTETSTEIEYEIRDGLFKLVCKQASSQNKIHHFDEAYNDFAEKITEMGKIELKSLAQQKPFDVKINSNKNCIAIPHTDTATNMVITKKMIEEYVINNNVIDWKTYVSAIGEHIKANYEITIESKEETVDKYVLIIDEINRGNVSAIFGELITLLESDKRQNSEEVIEAYLPYSQTMFSVPSNLYIIGTMNTADRSVEALDTALRRRFSFKEVPPNPELLENLEYHDVSLSKLLTKINQRIEVLIDKDHKIGHSYFFEVKNLEDLKTVFKDKIIPLLEEYFYGDFGKIGLVLGEVFVKGEDVKNTDVLATHSKYDNSDFLNDKTLFSLNEIEDMSISDFVSIYDNKTNEQK